MLRAVFSYGIFILLFLSLLNPLLADTIYLKKGKAIEDCNIVKETMNECHYKIPGINAVVKHKWKDIERIEYTNVPSKFSKAEAAFQSGDLESARKSYTSFILEKNKSSREEDVFEPKARYKVAKVYLELAPVQQSKKNREKYFSRATSQFEKVTKSDSRLKGDALAGLIEGNLATKDYNGAKKAAEALRNEKISDFWNLQAELYQSHILFFQDDFKGASRKYESLAGRARRDAPLVQGLALVGKGRCELALGDKKEAMKTFKDVVSDSEEDEALAGAYNGIGDVYRKNKEHKEALMAYLRVVVMYSHVRSELPKGLYYAGKAFLALKDENPSWGGRGSQLIGRQKQEFPAWKAN